MLPLNVPLLPDDDYLTFLAGLGQRIHAVHFSLYDAALCDARVRMRNLSVETLADHLRRLPGPKKYLLANGRFHPSETYTNEAGGGLPRLIERLEYLLDAGVLDGLVFADSYLLTALGDAAPQLAARLEAVPSVNFVIDGIEGAEVLLDLVAANGFRPPGKLSLDRGLNRRPGVLKALSAEIRRRWPEMKIELLANEGCLDECPFRATHEALIAAANGGGLRVDTRRLNRDLACLRILSRAPHRILASPFIRPEDAGAYADVADLLKICGRTLGAGFLKPTVGAYATGAYAGNLFDLLDACHWMGERWELPNAELPEDLLGTLCACDRRCGQCTACETLFQRHARPKTLTLKDLRTAEL